MSSNTELSVSPAPKPASSRSAKPSSSAKTKSTVKKVAGNKKNAKSVQAKVATHPSWKEIIKECIIAHRDEVRSGVSRSTIKKFAEEKYKLVASGTQLYQLNHAIAIGAESGIFSLPKGPSGKVKLAPKVKPDATKENSKPPSTVKKVSVTKKSDGRKLVAKVATKTKPKALTKTTAASKTSGVKKAPAKVVLKKGIKATAPARKVAPAKKVAPANKSAVTKKVTAKTVEKKRTAAKVAATRPKSRAKPASKAKKVSN